MKKLIFSLATLLIPAAVFAFSPTATNWQMTDKYTVKFTGGGELGGIFKTMKGAIMFDDQHPESSSFDLSIDVASINTGNGLMNTHAKSAEWFDAGQYPVIKFTSKKIMKARAGYQVTGDMVIHGVKKELTLPFSFQNGGAAGTFSAKFNINRSDFHVGKPGGDVDENIKLELMVPVVKK
jgi:polyisoprenoid-binding protein YceI